MDYNVYVAIKRSLWMLFLLSNKVFHTNSKWFQFSAQAHISGGAFEVESDASVAATLCYNILTVEPDEYLLGLACTHIYT